MESSRRRTLVTLAALGAPCASAWAGGPEAAVLTVRGRGVSGAGSADFSLRSEEGTRMRFQLVTSN